nr:MAG TPA: multi-glycosylated core protein [Caudoviricetes sp.]
MMSKRDKCSLKLLGLVILFALIADQSLRYTDIIFSFISGIAIVSAVISLILLCWQMYYSRR